MIENQTDKMAGRYGCHIIVGNAARVAPERMCYGSIDAVSDSVIISELKVGSTAIVAGSAGGEETFRTIPFTLPMRWLPFANDITSIKLTGATDIVIAWLKPL